MLVGYIAHDLRWRSLPFLRSDWPSAFLAAHKGIVEIHLFLQKSFLGSSRCYLLILPLPPALARSKSPVLVTVNIFIFLVAANHFIFKALGRLLLLLIDIILRQEFCRWLLPQMKTRPKEYSRFFRQNLHHK